VTAESESSTASVRPVLPGARWALALGGVLLAGFLIIVVCAWIDRGRRSRLETVSQGTAVEDKTYYSIPADDAGRSAVAVRLGGRSLYLVSPDLVELRDSDALRVAVDSAKALTIYQTENLRVLSAKEKGNTYLLKAEPGKYVKVRPSGEATGKK
jgi:hypothetical protein